MYLIISSAKPSRISDLSFGGRDRTVPFTLKYFFSSGAASWHNMKSVALTETLGQVQDRDNGDDNIIV